MEVAKEQRTILLVTILLSTMLAVLYYAMLTYHSTAITRGLTTQVLHVEPQPNGLGSITFDTNPSIDPAAGQVLERAGSNFQSPLAFE